MSLKVHRMFSWESDNERILKICLHLTQLGYYYLLNTVHTACSTQKQTDNEHIKAIKESNLKHSKTLQSTTERYVQMLSDFFFET